MKSRLMIGVVIGVLIGMAFLGALSCNGGESGDDDDDDDDSDSGPYACLDAFCKDYMALDCSHYANLFECRAHFSGECGDAGAFETQQRAFLQCVCDCRARPGNEDFDECLRIIDCEVECWSNECL